MEDLLNAIAPMILLGAYIFLLCIFPSAILLILVAIVIAVLVNLSK